MRRTAILCGLLLLAASLFFVISKRSACNYVAREELAMDTFVKITMEKSSDDEAILNEAFSRISELEKVFNVHDPDSEISRLNRLKKSEVSEELLHLIKKSITVSKVTGGAFDITVLPLMNLYRNAEKRGTPPSEQEIRKTLEHVGWERIGIRGNTVIIPESIDMGGIAKGYIVDRTAEFLKEKGVRSALINAGGDIYCFGKNPDGRKWKVGVQDPFRKDGIRQIVRLTDYGIATSGDYERYLKIKGKKYGHIVNPRTGESVQNYPAGVTVIADNAATADGFATAFFVLGIEKSIELANMEKNLEVLLIDDKGKIHESRNFSKFTAP